MPEIKNNFTQGKMNKDLDERLVPSGQYRDAVNIQVSTSEGAHVGALENVLGNSLISEVTSVSINSTCVGSISDEKKDALYYFVASSPSGGVEYNIKDEYKSGVKQWNNINAIKNPLDPNTPPTSFSNFSWKDRIFEYKKNISKPQPIFVDNFLVKTRFDSTSGVNNIGGLNINNPGTGVFGETSNKYYYVLDIDKDIYPGMTCYFFNGAQAVGVVSGNANEWDLVGENKVIIRKVIEVDYITDPLGGQGNVAVIFDKPLNVEHTTSILNSPGAPWIDSTILDYNYLLFSKKRLLNFNCNNLITGINIIDDFLLWTDNDSEPKKIHIPRSAEGTHTNGEHPTYLIVPERSVDITHKVLVGESNITVVKKYPKEKLLIEEKLELTTSAKTVFNFVEGIGPSTLIEPGKSIAVELEGFENGNNFNIGDELRFLSSTSSLSLPDDFNVRCKVLENLSGQSLGPSFPGSFWPANVYLLEILSISNLTPVDLSIGLYTPSNTPSTGAHTFNIQRVLDTKSLFEKKFARFGYRWKYQDGEYSTFSPFSDIVFEAGFFNYDSKNAYNTAMQNHLIRLTLRNIISKDIPLDVIQVDILYVESNSSTIYVVDKIRHNDYSNISIGRNNYNNWKANQIQIKSDIIYAAVPSNQFLRAWDNVPRKALSQEVTGNRVVYGNYLQNYSLNNYSTGVYEKPVLEASLDDRWNTGLTQNNFGEKVLYTDTYYDSMGLAHPELNFPYMKEKTIKNNYAVPSIKSLRKYQLGFTYFDEYGRETPVFSNSEATTDVTKKYASDITLLSSKILSNAPSWAKNFRIYVKETSNEYYNLALDRVYRAEDGNLWLAFPSSERNKVDEETFLILKKGADSDALVEEEGRYKVVAIENEVPEFLKTKERFIGKGVGDASLSIPIDHLFQDSSGNTVDTLLTPGGKSFKIYEPHWKGESGISLDNVADSFDFSIGAGSQFSRRYDIANVSFDNDEYTITLDKYIDSDEDWMYASGTTNFNATLELRFYKNITRMKPEFNGKFFVKINGNSVSELYLNTNASSDITYAVTGSFNFYYFSDTGKFSIVDGTTKLNLDNDWNYYTSSGGINPHDGTSGAVIHSGGVTQAPNELSTDGQEDWEEILDFSIPGSLTISNWFIDEVYYAGTHPAGSCNGCGENSPNHVSSSNDNFNYGNGIYEQGGQHYVEFSFSQIKPESGATGGAFDSNDELNYADFNESWIWAVGSSTNPDHADQASVVSQFIPGNKFRFVDDDFGVVYTISENVNIQKIKRYNHTSFGIVKYMFDQWDADQTNSTKKDDFEKAWARFSSPTNRRLTYVIPVNKDILALTRIDADPVTTDNRTTTSTTGASPNTIQFIVQRTDDDADILASSNPVIFETEPKEAIDLNLFYEASDSYPTELTIETAEQWIPLGSVVTCKSHPLIVDFSNINYPTTFVSGWELINGRLMIKFNLPLRQSAINLLSPTEKNNLVLRFTRPDGSFTTLKGLWGTERTVPKFGFSPSGWSSNQTYMKTTVFNAGSLDETAYEIHLQNLINNRIGLSWFNTYSFGNGVESNRLRDDFNQVYLSKGVKVSTTLDEPYEEERRGSGLIYSGLYNSASGVNNLNQFIQAEKITKDLNPTYGTIQKLFSRNTDLIAFCEDRVIRIAANKDAIFNADGNPQLIATSNVLGQVLPFSGDYGISKNPSSFASESYRAYFTDEKRGAVLRLSKDGITNIADYGMSDYFKDNLKNYNHGKILGTYDDNKNEYNLSLGSYNCSDGQFQNSNNTISFSERGNGWTSFKSFIPEQGLSCAGDYYTLKSGLLYQHHNENQDRNTFYGIYTPSFIEFYLNQSPDVVKSFKTLNYEGSQSRVKKEISGSINSNIDQGYYNLEDKPGWEAQYIITDLQKGKVQGQEFIKKEGKWFNHIQGIYGTTSAKDTNTDEFHFQGIGRASNLPPIVYGCTDTNANNTTLGANTDDGSCKYSGCTNTDADNLTYFYHPNPGTLYTNPILATTDDGSCTYTGCTDVNANNTNFSCSGVDLSSYSIITDNACCTYTNTYDCDSVNGGYTVNTTGTGTYTTQADALANCSSCGTSTINGCNDPYAMNYDPLVTCNNGTCLDYSHGCYDDGSLTTTTYNTDGYSIWASTPDSGAGSFSTCTTSGVITLTPYDSYTYYDPTTQTTLTASASNFIDPGGVSNAGMDCGCEYDGCMDNAVSNYMPWATNSDPSMCCVDGCMDDLYNEYDSNATCDDGSYCLTLIGNCTLSLNMQTLSDPPFNGNQPTTVNIPDIVFEEALDMAGQSSAPNNGGYFDSNNTGYNTGVTYVSDGMVCSSGFIDGYSPYQRMIIHSTKVDTLFMNMPNGNIRTGDIGIISDLSGLEHMAFSPNNYHLGIHLQNITNFTHTETDPASPFYGINILDTLINEGPGGLGSLTLKSLPLSEDIDLSNIEDGKLSIIDIADCGSDEIKGIEGITNLMGITITNNYVCGNSIGGGGPNQELDALQPYLNPNNGTTGSGWYNYNANPLLPDYLTDGSNKNYDGAIDSIGSSQNPLSNAQSSSGQLLRHEVHYSPGNNPWRNAWTGGGTAPDIVPIETFNFQNADNNIENDYGLIGGISGTGSYSNNRTREAYKIMRFINLPNLKHIYLDASFPQSYCQNAFSIGNDNGLNYLNKQAAAFTTKGCHADLKIHCGGSGSQFNIMEQSYGTARKYIDEPNNSYPSTGSVLNPNWNAIGEAFFLRYFEGTHRFVI